MNLVDELVDAMPHSCYRNTNSSQFSYWKIGGPVVLLVEPNSVEQLATAIMLCNKHPHCPSLIMGDGANLLFDSKGFNGVVIKIGNELSKLSINDTSISCEAGVWVPELAYRASSLGLSGIEHICGIPGRIGGLIFMNGGSNRQCILESTVSVELINKLGEIETVKQQDIVFSYRSSPFQQDSRIIARATFALVHSSRRAVRTKMREILSSRRKKFPRKLPSCGSVFLSDPAMYDSVGPPGYAIESAGLKGTCVGGAEISPLHANFIVNKGGASSDDVLTLIALARSRVYQKTKFLMNCEVRYVSPFGEVLPAHTQADRLTITPNLITT